MHLLLKSPLRWGLRHQTHNLLLSLNLRVVKIATYYLILEQQQLVGPLSHAFPPPPPWLKPLLMPLVAAILNAEWL